MSKLFPDDYIDSVYFVDFEKLYESGFRLLEFDVDNTLVPHGAPADDRARELFSRIKKIGFKVFFLSNNKEERVRTFCEDVKGDGYIYKAGKPDKKAYIRAAELTVVSRDQTIFFGDQIFTDILGANRAGIRSCMTRPVKKWHEEPQIVLKRFLEAIVLFFYRIARKQAKKPVPLIKED